MTNRLINLTISQAGDAASSVFSFHVRIGDDVVASNQVLTVEDSRRVREISLEYGSLFERDQAPKAAEGYLAAIGAELFSIWLAPFWEKVTKGHPAGASRQLLINSCDPEVLNLPWELLRPPHGEAIGVDGKWVLRRLPDPEATFSQAPQELPAGPLRVLYIVAAPTDQADLDFEKEEELLLRALSRTGHEAAFDSGDLGSFDELEQRISEFRPHVVHLTGHGLAGDDTAYFAFEDEHGKTDLRSASEIGQLFAGQEVQCAFISACQAGKAPVRNAQNGLAQGLLREGVPLVIGWTASILDDVATEVGARFYREVANGTTSIDRALISARQHARRQYARRSDPSWSLPVLYSATQQTHLFDPARDEARPRSSLRIEALPGMSEEGFTPHFIGRRREMQQLLPRLRTGEIQLAVLTGLGGAGKSTLATRLARKLEADGWTPIAISSSDDVPLNAAALLETCGDAFLVAGLRDVHSRLRDPALETAERLRLVVHTLNERRFVLLLDNFESNLDAGTYRILDPELAAFYKYLLARLQGKSRAIITTRYLPSDDPLPLRGMEWQLGEFGEAAFLKFMLRNSAVETRYREGSLPHDLLIRLHVMLGATPRFLGQIRKLLETMPAEELSRELDSVALSSTKGVETRGALQAERDAYCERIFTSRLYAQLSLEAQQMLRRVAVLGLAVPTDGLAAVGGLSIEEAWAAAETASRMALLHRVPAVNPLWSVYGTLRGWLLAAERTTREERRAAHLAAGAYLEEIDKSDREEELNTSFVDCLRERRAQYIAAEAWKQARYTTSVLSTLFRRRGLYAEIEKLHLELMDHDPNPESLNWIGTSYIARTEWGKAREFLGQSLAMAKRNQNAEAEASAWHQLASIDLSEGDCPAAREKFELSLEIKQTTGNRSGEVATRCQLASIDIFEGDYPGAQEKFNQALVTCQEIGDRAAESAIWHQLATIDLRQGDYPPAREKLARVLSLADEIGDLAGESGAWHQLASIDILENKSSEAQSKLERALLIKQKIGDRSGQGSILHQMATIALHENNYLEARKKYGQALEIKRQVRDPVGEAATWYQLGILVADLGEIELALRLAGLCWIIDYSIGHADTANDFHRVANLAAQLDYTPQKLRGILDEVGAQYQIDYGHSLLAEVDKVLEK
jgi:tetratricopeptide (TPR) repeat protein